MPPPEITAVRRPKRSTVYSCEEAICTTGAAWDDFACSKHWLLLSQSTQGRLTDTVTAPGTSERIDVVRKAQREWADIRTYGFITPETEAIAA
jgi:hypothetical protein